MKPPILLKSVLDILFILLLLSLMAPFALLVLGLIQENPIPIEINNQEIDSFTSISILILLADYAVSALSVYIVYLIRKLVRSFFKIKYFTRYQISLLHLIGQLIVLASIAELIVNITSKLLLESRLEFTFASDLPFGNLLFVLSLGLFFIYLSRLFDNAKQLKEENELTV